MLINSIYNFAIVIRTNLYYHSRRTYPDPLIFQYLFSSVDYRRSGLSGRTFGLLQVGVFL